MPKQYTYSFKAFKENDTYDYVSREEVTCREVMVSHMCDSLYHNAILEGLYVRSEARLNVLGADVPMIVSFADYIKETFYPTATWSIEKALHEDAFAPSTIDVVIQDEGLLAAGFLWWLVLVWRLHIESDRHETDMKSLILGSNEKEGNQWYQMDDRSNHDKIWSIFHKYRDPRLWFKTRIEESYCNGPISCARRLGEEF